MPCSNVKINKEMKKISTGHSKDFLSWDLHEQEDKNASEGSTLKANNLNCQELPKVVIRDREN